MDAAPEIAADIAAVVTTSDKHGSMSPDMMDSDPSNEPEFSQISKGDCTGFIRFALADFFMNSRESKTAANAAAQEAHR